MRGVATLEVELRVGDGGAAPLDRDDPLGLVGRDREQADAAVEVGEDAVGAGRLPDEAGEGRGAVGAALEEGVDRHPHRVAVDHLVHDRVLAPHHVGREIHDDVGRFRERGALAGTGRDAQRHLGRPPELAVAQELVDRRVRDHARVDHHRVVRLVLAERGLPVDDERAHRRAETVGRQQHRFGERRFGDVRDAVQRIADDVELQLRLHVGGDVLPPAAAAPFARMHARRRHARGRRLQDLDDTAP